MTNPVSKPKASRATPDELRLALRVTDERIAAATREAVYADDDRAERAEIARLIERRNLLLADLNLIAPPAPDYAAIRAAQDRARADGDARWLTAHDGLMRAQGGIALITAAMAYQAAVRNLERIAIDSLTVAPLAPQPGAPLAGHPQVSGAASFRDALAAQQREQRRAPGFGSDADVECAA